MDDFSISNINRGSKNYINDSWDIKEKINQKQNYLDHTWDFFHDIYTEGDCYILTKNTDVLGFSVMTNVCYLAILGVDPDNQRDGIGKKIMRSTMNDYNTIKCHTRVSNTPAIKFYKSMGFEKVDKEKNYYIENEDAFFLKFES